MEKQYDVFDLLQEETVENYENFKKNIVTRIAYLIGVSEKLLADENKFVSSEIEELKTNENARIIRSLCLLRTQFFRNYAKIKNARKAEYKLIEQLAEYLDMDSLKYLQSKGMDISTVSSGIEPAINVAYINQYIQNNIDKVKDLIPSWVKFKYIRSIFLMPRGYAGANGEFIKKDYRKVFGTIIEASKMYASKKNGYPYQMYITWPHLFREDDGNVLYNDLKFLKMLYGACGDRFTATKYLIDAKKEDKKDIYKFLENALNVVVYVDCENVDPYTFAACLMNLDEEKLKRIQKIKLYDDENTSSAWDYIFNLINIEVEHIETERLLEGKSVVDIDMALGISEDYYENDIDSAILVSSDSDFWTVINRMSKVQFFVMNEERKTSCKTLEVLDSHGVSHCFMSNFAQSEVQTFKTEVLLSCLESRIREFNETGNFIPLNVNALLTELFYEAGVIAEERQLEQEKQVFYNNYLKNGFVIKPEEENGIIKFKMQLRRR